MIMVHLVVHNLDLSFSVRRLLMWSGSKCHDNGEKEFAEIMTFLRLACLWKRKSQEIVATDRAKSCPDEGSK